MDFGPFDRLFAERQPRLIDDLRELCAIPSETAQPEPLAAASEWLTQRLRAAGCAVTTVQLPDVPTLVVGDIGPGPKTLLAVQHYDVQPADPLEQWVTPPFASTVRDGKLFARGVVDNKGHLVTRIHVIEAYREVFGELPCRVRFLVEGEEETGSPHLAELLAQRPDLTVAGGALNEGGQVDAADRPLLSCGVRGMLYVELRVRTLAQDAHSMHASLLPNAAAQLASALATLVAPDGTVTIDGFLDDALPPTPRQLAHLHTLPFEERAFAALHGAKHFVAGRAGKAAQVAQLFSPTCNITGMVSGWMGPGTKTILPAVASARLDLRLVPDQDPAKVFEQLERHLRSRGFDDVELSLHSAERPYWTPIDDPLVRAAERATQAVFGAPGLRLISGPGTAPMHPICDPHKVPFVALGMTHGDARLHAPNENLRLDLIQPIARATARFVSEFAHAG